MSEQDTLQRFIFETLPIRGEFINLQESFQAILEQHIYPPAIRRLLGEALCVAGLLSAVIKFNGRLTIQFRGKGKLKLLLAQCNNRFQIRGLAKWEGDLSYDDLMEAFRDGVLVITLDSGTNKHPYQGIISWHGNSLAASIEKYFQHSEQLNTKIWLAVNATTAAGYMLQIIPAKESEAILVEREVVNLEWKRIMRLTNTHLYVKDMLNAHYPQLLNSVYPEDDIRIFSGATVSFHCTCTRKRGEDAILLLGPEETEAELKNNQTIVVTCDFCNKKYVFDRVDVAKIFRNQDKPSSGTHLH